jgi:hypothetical protein
MLPSVREANEEQNFIIFGAVNTFLYTNHRGETATYEVIPCCLRFGHNEYHKEGQWLLECVCPDKPGVYRTFALKDIHPR